MKTGSLKTGTVKIKKQKNILLQNGKFKKKKPKAHQGLKVLHTVCENGDVGTYFAKKTVKSPLYEMLQQCSTKTLQQEPSIDNFIPNFEENDCSIHYPDYKVPMPEIDDYEDVISELGSSDLGSLVETESEEDSEPIFVKQKVGEYQLYQVPTGAVILLYGNSKLFIHGVMRVTVLYGAADIFGKQLDKMSPPSMVYSPKGSALLTIENLNIREKTDDHSRKVMKKCLIKLGIDAGVCRDVALFKLKPTTVVLHCENVIDKATEFLESNLAQHLYPKLLNSLRCHFKNVTSQDWNILQVNEEWAQLFNLMNIENLNEENHTRLMLCGGKGVGKSTLLRYLVNKLLNVRKEVYVMDLDPGQPEFTVPGAISIIKVTSALLGPNYTHLQEAEKTIFVPSINVSADYESYLDAVRKLITHLPQSVPVVVNYMGFTKGIGLFLTSMILGLLKADVVVQIESQNENRNFNVDLTPDAVRQQLLASSSNEKLTLKEYKLVKMDSVANGNQANVGWELEPRQVREMCILAYMSGILPPQCKYLTEKDIRVYQTSLDEVTVLYNGKVCDPSAANANIVALCTEDSQTCVGWGIVRGICKLSNSMLLLTPVSSEQLEMVKYVIVGSVTLPPSIYLRHHDAIRGLVPFTFMGELTNFARTPKRNILHKQRTPVK